MEITYYFFLMKQIEIIKASLAELAASLAKCRASNEE